MLNRRADKLELLRIAEAVALEKSIDKELIINSMETGIAKAAKSKFGNENEIQVNINRDIIPIRPPKEGFIRFDTPSPIWKARMVVCLVKPNNSPVGIIMGNVARACPLPEGIAKLINNWANDIPRAET